MISLKLGLSAISHMVVSDYLSDQYPPYTCSQTTTIMPIAALEDDEEDYITAEYDIYITPSLTSPPTKATGTTAATAASTEPPPPPSLYLLQYPIRDRELPYNSLTGNAPTEVRIKPSSGFLEIDVPINPSYYFNHNNARKWGSALSKAKVEGANGFGLSAGFAQNAAVRSQAAAQTPAVSRAASSLNSGSRQGSRRPGYRDDEDEDEARKMLHQTLGGQIIRDTQATGRAAGPQYMIGAFRGSELHLTPLTGLVQMRPQFHHLDATTQVERNSVRRANHAENAAGAARNLEPRLVQLTAKAAGDPESAEGAEGGNTKTYLAAAQEEGWEKLRYTDEDEDEAYALYHDLLFLGQGKDGEKEEERGLALKATMSNDGYLDAISAPRLDPAGGTRIMRPMRRRASKAEENLDVMDVDAELPVIKSPVSPKKVKKEPKGKGKAVTAQMTVGDD